MKAQEILQILQKMLMPNHVLVPLVNMKHHPRISVTPSVHFTPELIVNKILTGIASPALGHEEQKQLFRMKKIAAV